MQQCAIALSENCSYYCEKYTPRRACIGVQNSSDRQDSHFAIKFFAGQIAANTSLLVERFSNLPFGLNEWFIYTIDAEGWELTARGRIATNGSTEAKLCSHQSPLLCCERDYWFLQLSSAFFNRGFNSQLDSQFLFFSVLCSRLTMLLIFSLLLVLLIYILNTIDTYSLTKCEIYIQL